MSVRKKHKIDELYYTLRPHKPDQDHNTKEPKGGIVQYNQDDDSVWAQVYEALRKNWSENAASTLLNGVRYFDLPEDSVPQPIEIHEKLLPNGWEVRTTPGLVTEAQFFQLIGSCKAPLSTLIRNQNEVEHFTGADCIHDIVHALMIHDPAYREIAQAIGQMHVNANNEQKRYVNRLWWHCLESSLIREDGELKIYGAGPLSSPQEADAVILSEDKHFQFSLEKVLRSRVKLLHEETPKYFVIDDIQEILDIVRNPDMVMAEIDEVLEEQRIEI